MTWFETTHARFPDVRLEEKQLQAWLDDRKLDPATLTPKRLEEHFLACACSLDVVGAHIAFEREYLEMLRRTVSRLPGGEAAEEVLQRVRLRLLTATSERNAKLSEYRGEGDFGGWLRTVALRVALSMRPARVEEELSDETLSSLAAAMPDPELKVMEAQQRQLFKKAFGEALNSLDARQRTILKMSVLDGLSIDQIAPLYQVHRATVARWLTSIRAELLAGTGRVLRERLAMTGAEVESLLAKVDTHLSVSLDRLLKTRA